MRESGNETPSPAQKASLRGLGRMLPWIIFGVALWILAMLLVVQQFLSGGASGDFDRRRERLNGSLRETLSTLGINAQERRIGESWESMNDENGVWEVVNWRIRIQPDFDIQNARHSLLATIQHAGAVPKVKLDPEDKEIPMIMEALIGDRLSHRLYFVATQPTYSPSLAVNAEAFLGRRWQRLSRDRRELDQSLYTALSSFGLNGPPLLIREYYQPTENSAPDGEEIFHWIINNPSGIDISNIVEQLRRIIPGSELSFSMAFNGQGYELPTLNASLGGKLTHSIVFPIHPDGRGSRLKKVVRSSVVLFAPPRAAIIIDDIGFDEEIAERFMRLEIPITLSIIPHLPFSRNIAERAYLRGREMMLHLPMEPEGYPETDPGRGAILVRLNAEEIRRRTAANIDAVPHIAGINNHMGSLAMANSQVVEEVLEVVRDRSLYFVDSRTTAQTVGFQLAQRLGIPSTERVVFIDSVDITAIDYRVEKLKELILRAKQRGTAVGIGHPTAETLEAVEIMAEEFRKEGVEIVYASEVVS